ncbi:MAG: ATPase [Methanobrevibacter thaueri]|nr:ATPase [Methanobrevibacter thaueri]
MNLITILLWITIAIIGAISIILVKLHYKSDELENDEDSILPGRESFTDVFSSESNKNPFKKEQSNLSAQTNPQTLFSKNKSQNSNNDYIVHEVEENDLNSFEYETQNQVLINYDNTVEKTQEPIKQSQMDIMTQNRINKNGNEESELKDLFTIDELIKESKRKDSEREKESQTIKREEDPAELDELKRSIKNKTEEPLIEEIITDEDKEETISDLIKDSENKTTTPQESETKINDVIKTQTKEDEKTEGSITNTLLNQEETEISKPALKAPSKVKKSNDYELGASIDDANMFNEEEEEEGMDLDYRKDLDKFTSKIKGSKIFQEVKEKLTPETEELTGEMIPQEKYIRNVNQYDEYEPIINETHIDYEANYDDYHNGSLRQANTKRVLNNSKSKPLNKIKNKPARNNIKITLNNNEMVLKKGDEIIFNHEGETYSSQVYAINGDDISVKYRRKNIKIKPNDVKKIY